jgi:hypothetical protein
MQQLTAPHSDPSAANAGLLILVNVTERRRNYKEEKDVEIYSSRSLRNLHDTETMYQNVSRHLSVSTFFQHVYIALYTYADGHLTYQTATKAEAGADCMPRRSSLRQLYGSGDGGGAETDSPEPTARVWSGNPTTNDDQRCRLRHAH